MNPSTFDPTSLATADEAIRAAQAIAADPTCAPRSAAAPLAAAWRALARAAGSPDPEALHDRLPANVWSPRERDSQRGELTPLLAEASRPPELALAFPLTRPQLLTHAARLARMIAALRPGARAPGPWPRRLTAAAVLALLALLFARPWQSPELGPWRGAYHSLPDFTGDVTIRRDLDLRFDWGRSPPLDAIPANKYSVRWDTCLTLDAPREVTFQLTTDNRAKLTVDDRLIVRTAGAGQLQARGAARKLAAGVHRLRVDYQKTERESHIGLTASLDGEPPTSLPFSRLSAPRDPDGACD